MKIVRILPAASILALLSCAALAQAPNQIPVGSSSGVYRPPAGSRRPDANPSDRPTQPAGAQPSAANTGIQPVSRSCSQQANAQGLHGKARRTFREKCKRSGGR